MTCFAKLAYVSSISQIGLLERRTISMLARDKDEIMVSVDFWMKPILPVLHSTWFHVEGVQNCENVSFFKIISTRMPERYRVTATHHCWNERLTNVVIWCIWVRCVSYNFFNEKDISGGCGPYLHGFYFFERVQVTLHLERTLFRIPGERNRNDMAKVIEGMIADAFYILGLTTYAYV